MVHPPLELLQPRLRLLVLLVDLLWVLLGEVKVPLAKTVPLRQHPLVLLLELLYVVLILLALVALDFDPEWMDNEIKVCSELLQRKGGSPMSLVLSGHPLLLCPLAFELDVLRGSQQFGTLLLKATDLGVALS